MLHLHTFAGIRGEDAGELGCCKTGGENQAAYITLKVNGKFLIPAGCSCQRCATLVCTSSICALVVYGVKCKYSVMAVCRLPMHNTC